MTWLVLAISAAIGALVFVIVKLVGWQETTYHGQHVVTHIAIRAGFSSCLIAFIVIGVLTWAN